jgi:hypothetical protein
MTGILTRRKENALRYTWRRRQTNMKMKVEVGVMQL